jgi:FkbM family methyltransferase
MKVSGVRLKWGKEDRSLSRGTVYRHTLFDREVLFFVENESDIIQQHHARGVFFEQTELAALGKIFKGGTFVDVGANVGNHTLFAGLFLGAHKIIAFEPDWRSRRMLDINVRLNRLSEIVEIHAVGLSDVETRASISRDAHLNLGATRVVSDSDGDIQLVRGDSMLVDEKVALLKVDVESSEIAVLRGLRKTIERDRPLLFIEVDDENRTAFLLFLDEISYAVEHEESMPGNANFLAVPRS